MMSSPRTSQRGVVNLGGLGVICFLAWLFWIFFASVPDERMRRACRPVNIVGNVFVSLTALGAERAVDNVKGTFNSVEYGCRYMVWRLLYEEDYLEYIEDQEQGVAPAYDEEGGAEPPPADPENTPTDEELIPSEVPPEPERAESA